MPFPHNLRRLRLARFLSQAELARRSDLHTLTISRLESGRAKPSTRSVRALADGARSRPASSPPRRKSPRPTKARWPSSYERHMTQAHDRPPTGFRSHHSRFRDVHRQPLGARSPLISRRGVQKDTLLTTSVATRTAALTKDYKYGFSDPEQYAFKSRRGLDREIVEQISAYKNEPDWMLQFRLRALDIFLKKPMPTWPAADLSEIDFQNIFYYVRPTENSAEKYWDDVPAVHQGHLRQARHPRGGAEVPGGRLGAVRVGSRLPLHSRGPGEAGRHLPGHGLRPARVPGPGQGVLRHGHPGRRQQVLRAELGGLVGRHRSSTCPRTRTSRFRCRPTSASTPRTWASSSGR